MSLYLWWCLEVLHTFLAYSTPYLTEAQHEQCSFEQTLGGNRLSMYQVYIIKDYCSTMHTDQDIIEFILCYIL